MNRPVLITWLLMSWAGTAMTQSTDSHLQHDQSRTTRTFYGWSRLEIDVGRRNTMIIGFDTYSQLLTHQNVDSVLRLFVADYGRVADTAQDPTQAVHAFFRIARTDHTLDLRHYPPVRTSFRFSANSEPVLLKTRQDTLDIAWSSTGSIVSPDPNAYPFHVYLLVNRLADIEQLLREGGVNSQIQKVLEAIRTYQAHKLTHPGFSYDLLYRNGQPKVMHPGLAKSPFLSIQPNIGVGLIRSLWVPSLALDLQFIPNRFQNVGYSVGYLSNFFFQPGADGGFRVQRNDFLNIGVAFYAFDGLRRTSTFSRVLGSINVGIPVYRQGNYFDKRTFRFSGTIFQKSFIKVQPEIYMQGFFKKVYPGVRIGIGL
ncbi:hypothetical protein GCM10023187_11160 [Nibrella viscosa]|uniref:Uncharacterized protein n=1 Tax=Nibrella viscosa TaxID=1084524 RepID=A0ABP8K261_9BACT